MRIQIIQVPYDSGCRNVRMGRGPEHLVRSGLRQTLQNNGHEVHTEVIEATSPFRAEISTAFELHRLVAEQVQHAAERENFPLVLSGTTSLPRQANLASKR